MIDIYKLLKNPTRRKIIEIAMKNKEVCNSTLAKLLNVTRSSITYHLKILENVGIIKFIREEDCGRGIKKKYYKLNEKFFNRHPKEIPAPLLFEIYKRLKEKFSDEELYKIGFEIGYNTYADKIQSNELTKILEEISKIFNREGFGISEVIDSKFRMYSCYSCSLIESTVKSHKISCNLERGLIVGILTKKLGREVTIQTLKCRKEGDDYCEFEIV